MYIFNTSSTTYKHIKMDLVSKTIIYKGMYPNLYVKQSKWINPRMVNSNSGPIVVELIQKLTVTVAPFAVLVMTVKLGDEWG